MYTCKLNSKVYSTVGTTTIICLGDWEMDVSVYPDVSQFFCYRQAFCRSFNPEIHQLADQVDMLWAKLQDLTLPIGYVLLYRVESSFYGF